MLLVDCISTARADFSLVEPVANSIAQSPNIHCRLISTGSHESNPCDYVHSTYDSIFLPVTGLGSSLDSSAQALSILLSKIASLWSSRQPNLVFILGDRFELLPVVNLCVLYGIPIAHAFGGEVDSSYCLDTQVRDSITKSAHIHIVSHEAAKDRLLLMGEEEWRIHVTGNPALDNIESSNQSFLAYAQANNISTSKLIAACYLPPTTNRNLPALESQQLFSALQPYSDYSIVWAGVNADPGSDFIRKAIHTFIDDNPNNHFSNGLGRSKYHGLLQSCKFLIGNSSSGLLEMASFGKPAINIGNRQSGRLSPPHVLNCPAEADSIGQAITKCLYDRDFLETCMNTPNPFAAPHGTKASASIANHLSSSLDLPLDKLMVKRLPGSDKINLFDVARVPDYSPLL